MVEIKIYPVHERDYEGNRMWKSNSKTLDVVETTNMAGTDTN